MSPRPFGRRTLFVGPVAFRHNLRFRTFLGNTCFTNPFFDPLFCQQFFSSNRFLLAQVALPYPYFYPDYDSAGTVQPQEGLMPASAPVQATPAAPAPLEPLLIEWQGDHFVRMTLSHKSSAVGQSAPDYSEKSTSHSPPPARKLAVTPRELPPAVLIFRDGRTEEVGSYTIISGTIYSKADYWSSGSCTRKIKIDDLDVPATLKRNQERGLKFALPAGPNEVVIRP